jgi:hypothetical protein
VISFEQNHKIKAAVKKMNNTPPKPLKEILTKKEQRKLKAQKKKNASKPRLYWPGVVLNNIRN